MGIFKPKDPVSQFKIIGFPPFFHPPRLTVKRCPMSRANPVHALYFVAEKGVYQTVRLQYFTEAV
jgi:hypothetical protein